MSVCETMVLVPETGGQEYDRCDEMLPPYKCDLHRAPSPPPTTEPTDEQP